MTGGIPGTTETRTLVWKERHNEDHLFGAVVGKTRRTKVDVFDDDFLKNGWTEDTLEHGVIQSYVESDTPKSGTTWIANQVRPPRLDLAVVTSFSAPGLGNRNRRRREKVYKTCEIYWSSGTGY